MPGSTGSGGQKKVCFVVSPIGEAGSNIRQRADRVLRVIRHAIKPLGFEALRADDIATPGLITHQVIGHLLDDPLVIADLTGANPNVYYELAIRHAAGKPCVQILEDGEPVPFDLRELRTVVFRPAEELETVAMIEKAVAACLEPGFKVVSPISALGRLLPAM